jgi:hypothetical protein
LSCLGILCEPGIVTSPSACNKIVDVGFDGVECENTIGHHGPIVPICCGRNSQPRQDNDLMNVEQKSMSSDQEHVYQEMTRLVLIIGRRNKNEYN